jgi:predicted  nucleic acid-binding Zn-ribbon protein
MDDAAKMFELQKVDVAWARVARRIKQLQEQLGESEELRAARQQAEETETELHAWRAKQKNAELEAASLAERIRTTETRLMSGEVRSPKELEQLQASLEPMRRHRSQVDEDAVEALMQAEELTTRLSKLQTTLADLEQKWTAGQGEVRQEELKLKQNYVLLKRKREQLAAGMGDALLERYEYTRRRKAGVAVATVENGACSACHVRVPTGVANGLRAANSELVVCPSCGRYLIAG